MRYLTDGKRHLICEPYTIENLHKMAEALGIDRCWFHKDHYDIPKRRITEIEAKCTIISSKEIVRISRGQVSGWSRLGSDDGQNGNDPSLDIDSSSRHSV